MPKKFIELLYTRRYPLLLTTVVIILCLTNYGWGSTLSGWDNLHPEFNFNEYLKRIFFSVWQQHQGLGAVATQAHASEIPRVIYLYLTSLILPTSLVRWFYFFLMLLIGPLGVFYVSKYIYRSLRVKNAESYAFLSGLFYLLNLGTLQHFYVPLEMFATLYGFIGWLFLYILRYLEDGCVKDLTIFSFLTLASTSMAHTSTLWLMYFVTVVIFLLTYQLYFYGIKKSFSKLSRPIYILISTVFINLFWLLPNIYFVLTHANDVKNAKITRLFSEEAILNGLQYADFKDILVFKNFLFNWKVHRGQEIFTPIFIEWQKHLGYGFFLLGFLFASVFLYGIYRSFINGRIPKLKELNKKSLLVVFFPIFIFTIFILKMSTAPFGFIFDFMINYLPLFGEALRFPFTKVSIQLMFVCSLYFGYGVSQLKRSAEVRSKSTVKAVLFILVFAVLIIFYTLPAFRGELFGPIMKVTYTDNYEDAYTYLNRFTGTRIAPLPVNSLYGWVYYSWQNDKFTYASYQGAGFSWFFSANPILEREFDRWFPTNEQFYNEFQYAIYSQNPKLLEYILQKYQIDYLLLDKNVITPGSPRATFFPQTVWLLHNTNGVSLEKTFGNIDVYVFKKQKIKNKLQNAASIALLKDNEIHDYVYAPGNFVVSNLGYDFSNVDSNFYGGKEEYIRYLKSEPVSNKSEASNSTLNSNVLNLWPFGNWGFKNPNLDTKDLTLNKGNVSYLFSDDSKLAKLLQQGNTLSFNSGNFNFLTIPSIGANKSIPTQVYLESSDGDNRLVLNYLYPVITNTKGSIIFSHQSGDVINLGDIANAQVLIDQKLLQNSFSNTYLLNSSSKAVVFESSPLSTINYSSEVYSAEPNDCGGNPGGSYGKFVNNHSIVLLAKNHNICTSFEQSVKIDSPSVVRVEFDYKSDTNNKPLYCFYDSTSGCVNKKYSNSPFVSAKQTKYIDYFYVKNPNDYNFSLILENPDTREGSAEISNIKASVYKVISDINLKPKKDAYINEQRVSIDPNTDYVLKLPNYDNLNFEYNAGTKYFNPTEKNCDNFNAKEYSRKLFLDTNEGSHLQESPSKTQYFKYKALDAISCDSIKTTNLRGDSSFLVTFNYQNITGKALDICIAGTNLDKCMILDRLEKKQDAKNPLMPSFFESGKKQTNLKTQDQKQSFILPSYPSVSEYTINIANQSIGRVASENNLYSVETNYVPYEFLKGIYLANDESQIINSVNVVSVNHKFPHRYDVTIRYRQPDMSKTSLLVLNQSFEKGWGLYEKDSCKLGIVSPLTCKKAKARHVLAKNWANGWLLEGNKIQNTSNKQIFNSKSQVSNIENQTSLPAQAGNFYILFWPQWLQYLGYIFLLVWISILAFLYFRSRA